jgi:natural product precursor
MKEVKKIALNKLQGAKMSNQEIKSIVGGYNYTSCCGSGCVPLVNEYGWGWVGCWPTPNNQSNFCCYG